MTLTISDLDFQVELPELPRSVLVPKLEVIEFRRRQPAIDVLIDRLRLGQVTMGETPAGTAMASERGEIEYYSASGAIWARDATAGDDFKSELRNWDGLEEIGTDDGIEFGLDRRMSGRIIEQAMGVIERAGFREEAQGTPTIKLDQVAELDETGEVIHSGAGSATIALGYTIEGLPVMGAGAKTLIFADPGRDGIRITGAFHCWRPATEMRQVHMDDIKQALGVGVLGDPELALYHEKGARIEVTELTFGYLALPAMMRQATLFPAFAIAGRVQVPEDKMEYFEFARYHHAVGMDRYREAGLTDHYLGVTTD